MADDRGKIVPPRTPTERVAYSLAGRHETSGVTFAPRRILDPEIDARNPLDGFDHGAN